MKTDVIRRIFYWQKETFPGTTVRSAYKHYEKEHDELKAVALDPEIPHEEKVGEAVDCIFLLLRYITVQGEHAEEALERTLARNKEREWLPPDEDGCVHHVKGES